MTIPGSKRGVPVVNQAPGFLEVTTDSGAKIAIAVDDISHVIGDPKTGTQIFLKSLIPVDRFFVVRESYEEIGLRLRPFQLMYQTE